MPLGKYRQRPEKQLSDGLLIDGLFDQLLDSLKQDGEPLPSDKEFRRGLDAWRKAHQHEEIWYENENMPWPLRRYWALKVIRAFTCENWLRLHEVINEDDETEELQNGGGVEPLDEEQVMHQRLQWRTETIRRYRLEALVTGAER